MSSMKSLGGEEFEDVPLINYFGELDEEYDVVDGVLMGYRGSGEVLHIPEGIEQISLDFIRANPSLKLITIGRGGEPDVKPSDVYCRVNAEGRHHKGGNYMQFGSYPASLVTDKATTDKLTAVSGRLPTDNDCGAWHSYKYYIGNGTNNSQENDEDYMWYIDITLRSRRYRGVYFTKYRPTYTSSISVEGKSNQKDNGYSVGKVYWFSYEPILWKIIEERGGRAKLLSTVLLDAQAYQGCYYDDGNEWYISYDKSNLLRDSSGQAIFANNYRHSMIRQWLNGDFMRTAFDSIDRQIISREGVDNSPRSTNDVSNKYAANVASTYDDVTLLSAEEVSEELSNEDKRVCFSDYAKCQGGASQPQWWLRSPKSGKSSWAHAYYPGGINYNGVYTTFNGVRPILWVRL